MAEIFKQLGYGTMPNAEAAATVVQGLGTVPASKAWLCKVIVYVTGAGRTVSCGFHPSDAALVAGEFLIQAEAMAAEERQEFGLRYIPAGYVFRGGQGTADADVQWEIVGIEIDV